MDTESLFTQIEEILKPWARWSKRVQPHVIEVSISRHSLVAAARAILDAKWGYLSAISGLHLPGVESTATEEKQWDRLADPNMHSQPASLGDSFLVLYHFCNGPVVLNLRVHPPSLQDAAVPSLSGIAPVASIYERELMEMFGIPVENTPDPSRFLLPEDWPNEVYPLRKSFSGLPDAATEG